MNYLFVMNSTGTCLWRVYPIARELEKEGHQVVTANLPMITGEQYENILKWADVLTFQMVCARDLVEKARNRGIYTIFDCDDLIDEVPKSHPSYKQTIDADYQKMFKDILKDVDLITVSTEPLFDRYKKYGEIAQIENYIPEIWERPQTVARGKTRVGWAGGMSHQDDLDFIAPVIKKVVDKYDVKFVYTGGGGWNTGNPDFLWKFEKDHFADIPIEKREFCFGSKPELWPDKLNSMRLDIALAPLAKNPFSECKSQIKYFEYAINRWPGVYQKFLYKDKVIHGKTGFLAETEDEWMYYIEKLINDPKLRKEMGERAYQHIKNHYTFEGNRDKWLEIYRRAGQRSSHRNRDLLIK